MSTRPSMLTLKNLVPEIQFQVELNTDSTLHTCRKVIFIIIYYSTSNLFIYTLFV